MSDDEEGISRKDHLAMCKSRALECIERGDSGAAFNSMLSDMSKHDETRDHIGLKLGIGLMMLPCGMTTAEIKSWIEGFN